jgi:hypothetical protein
MGKIFIYNTLPDKTTQVMPLISIASDSESNAKKLTTL